MALAAEALREAMEAARKMGISLQDFLDMWEGAQPTDPRAVTLGSGTQSQVTAEDPGPSEVAFAAASGPIDEPKTNIVGFELAPTLIASTVLSASDVPETAAGFSIISAPMQARPPLPSVCETASLSSTTSGQSVRAPSASR